MSNMIQNLVPEREKVDGPEDDGYDSDERPQWEEEEEVGRGKEKTDAELKKEAARKAQLGSFNTLKTGNAKQKYLSGGPGNRRSSSNTSAEDSEKPAKPARRSSLGKADDSSKRRLSTTGALSAPTEVFDAGSLEEAVMTGSLLERMGPNPKMRKWRKRFYLLKGTKLISYQDESGDKQTKEKDISGASVEETGHPSNKFSFNLKMVDGKVYEYAAGDKDEKLQWTNSLQQQIATAEIEASMGDDPRSQFLARLGMSVGTKVKYCGLTQNAYLNGKTGTVTRPTANPDAVEVRSDDTGEVACFYKTNLEVLGGGLGANIGLGTGSAEGGTVANFEDNNKLKLDFASANPMPTPDDQMFTEGDEFGLKKKVDEQHHIKRNDRLVLLVHSAQGDHVVEKRQKQIRALLQGKALQWEEVDGANPLTERLRNNLITVSGVGATYPQLFVMHEGGQLRFIGDYERVVELDDIGYLRKDIELGLLEGGMNKEQLLDAAAQQEKAAVAIQKIRRGSVARSTNPTA